MLQQILRDMYVDPDILAELPEEQKEMLFFKMRQEQIRRYNERESKNEKSKAKSKKKSTKKGKKVRILEDPEGNPWTWVYGETEGEITVEEKWQRLHGTESNKATKPSKKDGIVKRSQIGSKSIGSEANQDLLIVKKKSSSRSPSSSPDTTPRFAAVPTLSPKSSPVMRRKEANAIKNNPKRPPTPPSPRSQGHSKTEKEVVVVRATNRQIDANKPKIAPKPQSTNSQVAENMLRDASAKKPIAAPRNNQTTISNNLSTKSNQTDSQNKENIATENVYESFDEVHDQDVVSNEEWQKLLRKFKEADRNRSTRARRASREYRRQSLIASNPEKLRVRFKNLATTNNTDKLTEAQRPALPPKPTTLRKKHPLARSGNLNKPQNRDEVKEWFEDTQVHNLDSTNSHHFPPWLHGIITRQKSEEILKNKTPGDFLIRVSDKIWGYTLSYKDADRVKHFLIDASEEKCYHFFGNDQIRHESLQELIEYHKEENITYNGEKLTNYVGQADPTTPDYAELQCDAADTRL